MARTPPPAQSPPQPRRSAFTLIEMVVVIGIIGVLMAMGIPGIVSQIKRADLYNTTNIIATLHTYCVLGSRADLAASPVYTMIIAPTTISVKKDGNLVDAYEIGKQFAFVGGKSEVSLEDAFEPTATTTITYHVRTGFVTNNLPNQVKVYIRDKKTLKNKFELVFWSTGVLNVNAAP